MNTLTDLIEKRDSSGAVAAIAADPGCVSVYNEEGDSPLHLAIRHGLPEVVSRLLAVGVDVNVKGSRGDRPLHEAARPAYETVYAELLLDAGADVNAKNRHREPPLDIAAGGNPEVTALLLERGATMTLQSAVCLDDVEAARELLGSIGLMNRESKGQLLNNACSNGSPSILAMLLQEGVKPSGLALTAAISQARRDLEGAGACIRLLIEAGVDPTYLPQMRPPVEVAKSIRDPAVRAAVLEMLGRPE